MKTSSPVRFSAVPARSIGRLVKNTSVLMQDSVYGGIHNIQSFKNNAFIFSSLIQVLSRIFVANRTAKQTKDKPEGPFRYLEAVKTTFREAFGFMLNYGLLRTMQHGFLDYFRYKLQVTEGLPQPSRLFKRLFERKFGKLDITPEISPLPSLFQNFKRFGNEISAFVRGNQQVRTLTPIEDLFSPAVVKRGFHYNPAALSNSPLLEKGVNFLHKISRGCPKATTAVKLQNFLAFAPILLASVPAVILSGFMLERFSQNHAEGLAQKIAQIFHKGQPGNPMQQNTSVAPGNTPNPQMPQALDQSGVLPYANNQVQPVSNPGFASYGFPATAANQPGTPQWASGYSSQSWRGPGSFTPH